MRTRQLCFAIAWVLLPAKLLAAYQESFNFTTPAGKPYVAGTPLAADGDGTNNNAKFYGPAGVALDSSTNLYIADGNVIRRISRTGTNWVVTTLAGTPHISQSMDGTNSAALFHLPQGVALGNGGNLYVADTSGDTIRKVTPIGTNWVVTTLAGLGETTGTADGTNTNARFSSPYGITVDGATNIYVADTYNHTLRKVTPVGTNWVVTTIAGLAGSSGSANGTNSTARFSRPAAIAVDGTTNLYVADSSNNIIRKVTPIGTNWVVTTLAGQAGTSGASDGTNNNARFNGPAGVAVDSAGRLYVSDSGNSTIRRLRPSGTNWIVSTLAGIAGSFNNIDGAGSAARFDYPVGIAVDTGGGVYVMDNTAFTLRQGQLAILIQTALSGNQLTLSWPLAASNFVLETTSSFSPSPSWSRLTNAGTLSVDGYSFTTNIVRPAAYFRLHNP